MARNSMNLLDVAAWLNYNRDNIIGARLDNIYRENGVFLLKTAKQGREDFIVVEPGVRIHSTRRLRPRGDYKPYPLLVLARKHLRGARIDDVSMLGFDRLVEIAFTSGFKLVVELVPRGFLVLVDPRGLIIAADRYATMRDRVVKPKAEYKPPPLNTFNPFQAEARELASRIAGGRDLVRGLVRGAGVPGEVAEEAVYRSGLEPNVKPSVLESKDLEALAEALRGIWRESMNGMGYIAYSGGLPIEADPFKPLRLEPGGVVEAYPRLDDAYDDYFHDRRRKSLSPVDSEMQRLISSIKEAERVEETYRRMAGELRTAASLLAEKFEWASRAISCVKNELRKGGNPLLCDGVVDISGDRFKLSINGYQVTIRLGEDVDKVIVRLFREAGELEAKAKRAARAKEEVKARLEEVEVKVKARLLQARARNRRRYWFEKYHWLITRNGFLAIGGRDAGQNESIVRKYLEERDIFIHADIHGAPVVVLKTRGVDPEDEDILDAAVIAVAYSKAWKSGLGSMSAYWVWGDQVSKSPPSGEYLAKGGFIIRGKKNYMKQLKVYITIGVTFNEEEAPLVIVGPEDLTRERSIAYATLEPGDMKIEETARKLKEELYKTLPKEYRHLPLALPDEEIKMRIPGKSRVIRVGGGLGRNDAFLRHLLDKMSV